MLRPILIVILGTTFALAACTSSDTSAPAASPTPTPSADATPSPDSSSEAASPGATASPTPVRPGDAEPNPGGGNATPPPAPETAGVSLYRQGGSQVEPGGQVVAGELLDVKTGVGTFAPGTNVDYVMSGASGPVQFTAASDGSVPVFTLDAPVQPRCYSFTATDTAGTVVVTEVCVS